MKDVHSRLVSSPSFLMAEHANYKKSINACKHLRIRKEDSRFLSINWHVVVADVAKEFPAFDPLNPELNPICCLLA
jgi:hypothetical protein